MNTQGFTSAKQNERRCSRHPLQHTGDLYKKRAGHQDNQVDKSNIHTCRLSLLFGPFPRSLFGNLPRFFFGFQLGLLIRLL